MKYKVTIKREQLEEYQKLNYGTNHFYDFPSSFQLIVDIPDNVGVPSAESSDTPE